jgi:hypothetical protein
MATITGTADVIVDLWWMQPSRKARLSVNHKQLCGNNSEKQGNFYFLSSGHTDDV